MEKPPAAPAIRHPLARLFLGVVWIILVALGVQAALKALPGQKNAASALATAVLLAAVVGAYLAFVRLLERRKAAELAPRPALAEVPVGVALGFLLFATTIGIIAAFGDYVVTGRNGWGVLGPVAAGAMVSGVVEELLVRGIVFRLLEEWLGSWIALGASALLFGAMHLFNPHAGLVPAIAIALEAGVLLAAAFVLTRRLWLPIGLHVGWNFTQAGIFGVAVSGHPEKGLLSSTLRGPELISGGAFGAEASIFAVLVCLAAAGLLLWLAARRGRILAPSWMRRPAAVS